LANLSIKELSKRNNFYIFAKRISIGQGFYVVGQDKLILLDPSILNSLDSLEDLEKYNNGRSILLPTIDNSKVKLSSLYKDSEFSNRTQDTTMQQDIQVKSIANQIENIKHSTNKRFVRVRIGNDYYDIVSVIDSPFGSKSDFNFINTSGDYVGFVSHKHGNSPRDFQQWSGTSKRFQESIFNHPETHSFIEELVKRFDNGLPPASSVARKIVDEKLKMMSCFGFDYGTDFGLNNVNAIMQGSLLLKNQGDCYLLKGSHNVILNGSLPTYSYEPVFIAVHKKDRSDHGIKDARVTINPIGGRRIKDFV
jgi:hypothetical protein